MMASKEIEYKTVEDCFDIINSYKDVAEIKAITDLENTLQTIAFHHSKDGLNNDFLELLASFILSKKLKAHTVSLITQCLIPKELMSEDLVTKIVIHVLSTYVDADPKKTVNLIKWLIGLLEYEITDVSAINDFYNLFYVMMNRDMQICKYTICLIFMLSKPEDVTEDKVKIIDDMVYKYGQNQFTKYLYSLFKCYQPERLPLSTPTLEMFSIPKYLPTKVMEEALVNARARNIIKDPNGNNKSQLPFIQFFKSDKLKQKYSKVIIKLPDYDKNNKEKKNITEIESVVELEELVGNLSIPSNVICLLSSEAGLHQLAFGDEELQLKFAYKIVDVFDQVFIKRTLSSSYEEKDFLLKQLHQLEQYLEKGLPFVSRCLASYLQTWNGFDHFVHVMNLIKRITFTSCEELKQTVLLPLYNIFVTSNEFRMHQILSVLSELLTNMFDVDLVRYDGRIDSGFLGSLPKWVTDDSTRTLSRTLNSVKHFISVGLMICPESVILLQKAVNFYELLQILENRSNLAVMTIIPWNIVYTSFFSHNSAVFSSVSRLLFRYPLLINEIVVDASVKNFDMELKLINLYVTDIMNCLWLNQAITNRGNGMVFREMNSFILQKLGCIVKLDSAFSVTHHTMFTNFLITIHNSNVSLSFSDLLNKNLMIIMETYVPSIAKLIKANVQSPAEESCEVEGTVVL